MGRRRGRESVCACGVNEGGTVGKTGRADYGGKRKKKKKSHDLVFSAHEATEGCIEAAEGTRQTDTGSVSEVHNGMEDWIKTHVLDEPVCPSMTSCMYKYQSCLRARHGHFSNDYTTTHDPFCLHHLVQVYLTLCRQTWSRVRVYRGLCEGGNPSWMASDSAVRHMLLQQCVSVHHPAVAHSIGIL